jgi:tetratricopeptide (TPR) repeat protein
MQKPDTAVEFLLALEKKFPKVMQLKESLFNAYLAAKKYTQAQRVAETIAQAIPDRPIGYFLKAKAFAAEKQYPQSIKYYKRALSMQSDANIPIVELTRVYLAQGKQDEALKFLNDTLRLHKQHSLAYSLKGEVLMEKKEFKQAEKSFSKAIELNSSVATPYRNLAKVRLALDDADGAIAALKQGTNAAENSEPLRLSLALLYERIGQADSAIKAYENLLEVDSKSIMAINNLAMLLVSYREDEQSLAKAKELIRHIEQTDNPAYLDTIGWVHYRLNNFDKALHPLNRAVEKVPDSPLLRYHLGMTQFKQGQRDQAKTNLEQAVSSQVNFKGIEEARSTLQQLAGL